MLKNTSNYFSFERHGGLGCRTMSYYRANMEDGVRRVPPSEGSCQYSPLNGRASLKRSLEAAEFSNMDGGTLQAKRHRSNHEPALVHVNLLKHRM